jgi:hypothetical protein
MFVGAQVIDPKFRRPRFCGRRAEPLGSERDRLHEAQGDSPIERERMSQQHVGLDALGVEDAGRQTLQSVRIGLFAPRRGRRRQLFETIASM